MPAPYYNLRSKLDRAIVAYLEANLPAGSRIYPAHTAQARSKGSLTVRAHSGRPEVKGSGNWRFTVDLIAAFPALDANGHDNDKQRVELDTLFGKAVDLLMQAEDGAENLLYTAGLITTAGRALAANANTAIAERNADLVDFTCQWWEETGLDGANARDVNESDSNQFYEMAVWDAVCCAKQVD